MTHQQRTVSGCKSKERTGGGGAGGGKSKQNNFLKLSLPGGCSSSVGLKVSSSLVLFPLQDWDCCESSSSTGGYPRSLAPPLATTWRRSWTG